MEISWTFQFHRRHLLPRQQMPYLMEAIIILCHGMISNPAVVSIAIGKILPSGWDHVTFSLGCVKDLWVRGGIFLPAKFCDLENPLLLFKKDLVSMLFTSWQWSGGFGNKNILMIRTILDSFLKKIYIYSYCCPVTASPEGVAINEFPLNSSAIRKDNRGPKVWCNAW